VIFINPDHQAIPEERKRETKEAPQFLWNAVPTRGANISKLPLVDNVQLCLRPALLPNLKIEQTEEFVN